MSATADLQSGLAEAYDTLSDEFLPSQTVALAMVNEASDTFKTLLTISTKRFWEYSNFRKNFLLEVADDNRTLTTAMQGAPHVLVNSDVYTISAGDTLAPTGTNPVWQIYCDLFAKKG